MARMGRPRKEIDQKQFENLCALQCTLEEICDWFDVSDKTLNSWCKRTYGKTFSEVFKQKRGVGKISLRRSQWRLAENNVTMAIWLGKQYLGQRDQSYIVDGSKKDTEAEEQVRFYIPEKETLEENEGGGEESDQTAIGSAGEVPDDAC